MQGTLIFEDGSTFDGKSFGAPISSAGEIVFTTGMVGYPESFTDPSYGGQILIMTYPIIGNYGVPDKKYWETDKLQIAGLVVSNYIDTPSHSQSKRTLAHWLQDEHIPGLEIKDTRFLTQKLREKGTMLGKIIIDKDIEQYDPNKDNIVAKVSTKKIQVHTPGVEQLDTYRKKSKIVLLIDCGAKGNIARCLVKRGIKVIVAPWDFDPFSDVISKEEPLRDPHRDSKEQRISLRSLPDRNDNLNFDALLISNGPGDPKMADKTIQTIQKALKAKIPTLGICLGHQLLALAAGGDTQKLKYGHRSQNQPCIRSNSEQCYITTQNHGFHVANIPKGFREWFSNANDGTNEGIIHTSLPFMSVQFHPEATPGPTDTEWIFDFFLKQALKL